MTVAILIGSSRIGRQSHKIAYFLEKQIIKRGMHVDMIDLGLWEEVQNINSRVLYADGVILVTPEYHGSFSGLLKSALDSITTAELYRKPVGIVTVSSGRMGGILAAAQLQNVVLHLGGLLLPSKLLVPDVNTAFDEDMNLVNERTLKSAIKFLDDYAWLSEAVTDKKAYTINHKPESSCKTTS